MTEKYWTLKEFVEGESLNGKIVTLEVINNPNTDKILLKADDAFSQYPLLLIFLDEELPANAFDGSEVTIEGKTFIDINTILPSAVEEPTEEPATEEKEIKYLKVEKKTELYRGIHYGDGYHGYKFVFNRAIDLKEFIEFCYYEGYNLEKLEGAAWCEDHACIYPGNESYPGPSWYDKDKKFKIWTYLWVRAYTD